jgi:hypothetical protein
LPVKQQVSTVPPKIADLIKGKNLVFSVLFFIYSILVLPSSQVVVTELMSALDAFPLSTDELDIIMHKIANKQSVVKQDWNKVKILFFYKNDLLYTNISYNMVKKSILKHTSVKYWMNQLKPMKMV